MVNLFDYFDYREYLRDFYREKKKKHSFFSYRYIGSRLGIDSSYLIKVLQGSLHISVKAIPKIVKECKMTEKEARYFETLVLFGKAKTQRERQVYFEKLFSFSQVKSTNIEAHQFEFFQKWYYSGVWAIINFGGFDGNFDNLSKKLTPPIKPSEAKKAVELLVKLDLVHHDKKTGYYTSDKNITTGKLHKSKAIQKYQSEMAQLGREAIERFDKTQRNISTLTLTLPDQALSEIDQMVDDFRKTLIKYANNAESSDRVFQLNIQLFPISKPGLKVDDT